MPEVVHAPARAAGKGAKGAGGALGKKVGPLPLWGWAIVAGGGALLLRMMFGKKASGVGGIPTVVGQAAGGSSGSGQRVTASSTPTDETPPTIPDKPKTPPTVKVTPKPVAYGPAGKQVMLPADAVIIKPNGEALPADSSKQVQAISPGGVAYDPAFGLVDVTKLPGSHNYYGPGVTPVPVTAADVMIRDRAATPVTDPKYLDQ